MTMTTDVWDYGPAGLIVNLDEGLYAVVRDAPAGGFVAGFMVVNGRIQQEDCAPILRRHLSYWHRHARKID